MLLYDYFRSSAATRVRIGLNLKGLTVDRRYVHLLKGEQRAPGYLEVNPQGFVPTLEVGGKRLTQSLAILEYLEERHPLPALLPQGAEDRAWVRAIALSIACDIHPLNNTRVMKYLEATLGLDKARRHEWYSHWVTEGLQAIEPQLAERASGRFCFGDAPTLADVCLVPQVNNALRFDVPLAPYPRIRAIYEACLEVPAIAAAQPARQPDAE